MKYASLAVAMLLLAACETVPASVSPPPPGAVDIPSGSLELGDWRNANEAATLDVFQQNVNARYAVGVETSAAAADLRRNDFNCGDAPPLTDGRGDPPAQVCRRTTTASGCTHTWQVHLFDADDRLTRTRGLYDRRCGNEGLLGGPG